MYKKVALVALSLLAPGFIFSAFGRDLPKATCNESVFKPCICASKSPRAIKYRPALKECGGRAAAILEGNFSRAYSVVLRDGQNRDRWPPVGFNGCTQAQADLGLNRCSAFKCQKTIRNKGVYTCCFGAAGTAPLMSKASRMTIKLKDTPATNDPVVRVCLPLFSAEFDMN